ncbi:hypothetical protein KSX_94090 [Ktedonospora formicarum]|uniref:Uncharacterized protein n=1 Tax=Ktedonospora formicarum TaxID=2778364 RepID=A0A8J3I9R3_9CHLR|nr:hypothetical protein KSX_94090 [Ktedonospora formicarum]
MVYNVTLDNNAILALAMNEPNAVYLKPLIDFHLGGTISLSIGVSTFLEEVPNR